MYFQLPQDQMQKIVIKPNGVRMNANQFFYFWDLFWLTGAVVLAAVLTVSINGLDISCLLQTLTAGVLVFAFKLFRYPKPVILRNCHVVDWRAWIPRTVLIFIGVILTVSSITELILENDLLFGVVNFGFATIAFAAWWAVQRTSTNERWDK